MDIEKILRCAAVLSVTTAFAAPVVTAAPNPPPPADARVCSPSSGVLYFSGSVGSGDAKTYRELPFRVSRGIGRVEMRYGWTERVLPPTPLTATTLDLGLWDQHGYRSVAGFRGWSGSRQGRISDNQPPIFVQADSAERGYVPGVIKPGVWYADLGIAAVGPLGADYTVQVECKAAGGSTPANDPVDRKHIANAAPGWYHGDLHMHAYHSNPNAPDWSEFIARSRAARLDFLMVTEYVTDAHWKTLGAVQRANPDLLVWPGREVITYFGHVGVHGETPDVIDYRQGFENVSLRDIQRLAKRDGALFEINHPTIFPPPLFSNFCRGCYFELDNEIDWDQVDLMEVLNAGVLVTAADLGIPLSQPQIENPFLTTAIEYWQRLLRAGHKITAVSGSDSKGVEPEADRLRTGWGSSATAVYARELSRAGIGEGLRAGHAYIRAHGVERSPALEFTATTLDGRSGMFGDTLTVAAFEPVRLRTVVRGGEGQLLTYYRNGLVSRIVPITGDPFIHETTVSRGDLDEGPLGTFWRIETRDQQSRTTIGNPIFLKSP